jgi:hypothetical protein
MAHSALKDLFQRGYLAKGAVANQNSVVFVSSACSDRYTTMYWYLLPQYMYVHIYIYLHIQLHVFVGLAVMGFICLNYSGCYWFCNQLSKIIWW